MIEEGKSQHGNDERFRDEFSNVDPLAAPRPPADDPFDDPLADPVSISHQRKNKNKNVGSTPASAKKSVKGKREINPDFKDVQETGKWGNVSKREVMAVGIFVTAIMIAVIVVVVILTKDNGSQPLGTKPPVTSPTLAPSMQPAPEDQLAFILNTTSYNAVLSNSTLNLLPNDVAFYQQDVTETSPAVQRAMAWLLIEDTAYVPANSNKLVSRFALAVLYFNNGGASWTNTSNWLTREDICVWNGVVCDRFGEQVEEIDLSNNNLVGTVPDEIIYFQNLRSLWLRENELTGSLPALPLGQLPVLTVLYLDNNKLNGTISEEIRPSDGVLTTLYLQKNDLTGYVPESLCFAITYLGTDCSTNETTGVVCDCCLQYPWPVDPCY